MIKRNVIVRVRLSEKEYRFLCQKAQEDPSTCYRSGGKNLSAYIRKCILNGSGYQIEESCIREIKNLTYQVRKIGVNINQVTRRINSGSLSSYTVQTLFDLLKQVDTRFEDMLEQLRRINEGTLS